MIDREHELPVTRQCELLNLARSTAYYEPAPVPEADLALMRHIDELHLKWPFLGSRRIRDLLNADGFDVGRKHVASLMRRMGIATIYRKPKTSTPGTGSAHRIYPYLLRGLAIEQPNHVWAADITYIPMAKGFVYLVAIMDWASRKVLGELHQRLIAAHRRQRHLRLEPRCVVPTGPSHRLCSCQKHFTGEQFYHLSACPVSQGQL